MVNQSQTIARLLAQGPIGREQQAPQQQQAQSPFVWGKGGTKYTPEMLQRMQQQAQGLTQSGMDFSPTGSIWGALGRGIQGGLGGFMQSRADNAVRGQRAADMQRQQQQNAAIANARTTEDVEGIMVNLAPDSAQYKVLAERLKMLRPELSETERMIDRVYGRGSPEALEAMTGIIQGKADPTMVVNTHTGTLIVPRSQLGAALGGGASPQSTPPPPIPFGKEDGGPTTTANYQSFYNPNEVDSVYENALGQGSMSARDYSYLLSLLPQGGKQKLDDKLKSDKIQIGR